MVLPMSRPAQHPQTGVYLFRQRVPQDLKDKLRGKPLRITVAGEPVDATHGSELKFSLRTKDAAEARQRHREVSAQVEAFWRASRNGPVALSQRQVHALAGKLYTTLTSVLGENPGNRERWDRVLEADGLAQAGELGDASLMIAPAPVKRLVALEERFGKWADTLLAGEGLIIDGASRIKLLEATAMAMTQAANVLRRNADGDFRPDPDAGRFGEWKRPEAAPAPQETALSIEAMYRKWATLHEQDGKSAGTRERFKTAVNQFRAFIGHDDARKVTTADVERWKDHLITGGTSSRTVATVSLPALRLVLDESLDGQKLTHNPAREVKFKARERVEERSKDFSTDEAAGILMAASAYRGTTRENAKNIAAKRWIPWLCAYSGARVGEIAQLRKEDVGIEDGIPFMRITPEAGHTKTGKERYVPLHPHLTELGFINWVEKQDDGPLFIDASKVTYDRPWRLVAKNLAEWIRLEVNITDARIQPNHAWRHTFKTIADEAGMDPKFSDHICGHTPRTEGHRYGRRTLPALHQQLLKVPRFDINGQKKAPAS